MEKRNVSLPSGHTLEVDIMPGFYERVRQHFSMSSEERVSDEHIRMFVFGVVKSAVDKCEPSSTVNQ
jgi:hypothetical protein